MAPAELRSSLPQDRGRWYVRRRRARRRRRECDPEVNPHSRGNRGCHGSGCKAAFAAPFHIPSNSKPDVVVPVLGLVVVTIRGAQVGCIVVPRPAPQHQTALPFRNANCPNTCSRSLQVSPWAAWAIHARILWFTSSHPIRPSAIPHCSSRSFRRNRTTFARTSRIFSGYKRQPKNVTPSRVR